MVAKQLSLDIDGFINDYNHLRTEEPTLPTGFPIVLANNMTAKTAGVEANVDYQPAPFWQLHGGAHTSGARAPRSEQPRPDPRRERIQRNDPGNQVWFRSFNLPARRRRTPARFVGALPHSAVPNYTELTLHLGWRHGAPLELALVGDNLLHASHAEFQIGAPLGTIHRATVLAQVTWRF